MSANFFKFSDELLKLEGGYQDSPKDKGNYVCNNGSWASRTGATTFTCSVGYPELVGTNRGISAPKYYEYFGTVPTVAIMKSVTKKDAENIYKKDWDKMKLDQLNSQEVSNIYYDMVVNSGESRATKLMQMTLNFLGSSLAVDGAIGNLTRGAINEANTAQLHEAYKLARKQFYIDLYNNNKSYFEDFIKGWLNRLDSFPDLKKKTYSYL